MTQIEFFKLQAKNLFRDFKTKTQYFDKGVDDFLYRYTPKYFDIDSMICDFDIKEDNFSLMKAQHIVAQMVGFNKWSELLRASESELELAKLLFDNQDKISIEDWEIYIEGAQDDNNTTFTPDDRLEIFKQIFVSQSGHENTIPDYRLNKKAS